MRILQEGGGHWKKQIVQVVMSAGEKRKQGDVARDCVAGAAREGFPV